MPRRLARMAAWILAALATVALVWLLANRTLDATLSPQARRLLQTGTPIADDRNVVIGLLGLTAPAGADFMAHGAMVNAAYARNLPYGELQAMTEGPDSLQPTFTSEQVNCWLEPDVPFHSCLPFEEAARVLAVPQNRELLARYKSLYNLDGYFAAQSSYNRAFLPISKLAIAEMQFDLRAGRHETAFQEWRRHLEFSKRTLRGSDTWVGKAVGLVLVGMSSGFADSLLSTAPHLAKRHRTELLALLQFDGIEALNPEALAHAEFRLLARALTQEPQPTPWGFDRLHLLAVYTGQHNRMLNRYSEFLPKYVSLLRTPWLQSGAERSRLRGKYVESTPPSVVVDPFGTAFLSSFIDSQLKARELARQALFVDGRMRLHRLAVNVVADSVADGVMQEYLESTEATLRDPFRGTPARWDAGDRKIYFVSPDDKCEIVAWTRIPDRSGAARRRPLKNFSAC